MVKIVFGIIFRTQFQVIPKNEEITFSYRKQISHIKPVNSHDSAHLHCILLCWVDQKKTNDYRQTTAISYTATFKEDVYFRQLDISIIFSGRYLNIHQFFHSYFVGKVFSGITLRNLICGENFVRN